MTSFHTAAFPDSLAIGKGDALTIGTIDRIQVWWLVAVGRVHGCSICFVLAPFILIEKNVTTWNLQKLHVRTVPLGEQPRRIAHNESAKTFAVITTKATMTGGTVMAGVDSKDPLALRKFSDPLDIPSNLCVSGPTWDGFCSSVERADI